MMMRILILLSLLITGCISEKTTSDDIDSSSLVLENGDFVKMDFTGRIKDAGAVFDTTYADVAFNSEVEKMDRFTYNNQYEPIEFTLGQGQILPALEEGMIGMKIGEERNITLTPVDGYGEWSPDYTVITSRVAVLPKLTDVLLSDFMANTGKQPEENETVRLNYWTARVVTITNSSVTLLHEPEEGITINTDYGPAAVTLNDTHIVTNLSPERGAVITTFLGEGVISDINDTDFTIDFNHPLAGKPLIFEVNVREIIKAEQMLAQKIVWTDYETGIKTAENKRKPAVVVLYLEDCQACEALDVITFSNPQVTKLKDEFVWIKVDVAANPRIGNTYEVKRYPAIVLLKSDGEISREITGYIPPTELSIALGLVD